MEERWSEGEEILWSSARQFAEKVDCGGDDGCIWIFQFFLEPRQAIRKGFWVLLYYFEKSKDDPFADVGP